MKPALDTTASPWLGDTVVTRVPARFRTGTLTCYARLGCASPRDPSGDLHGVGRRLARIRWPRGHTVARATFSKAWRAGVEATGAGRPTPSRPPPPLGNTHGPHAGVTTKEPMARIGHDSPRAALIYQHATAERDSAVAAFLDEIATAATVQPRVASIAQLS
jgi:hypothetical protein